MKKETTWILIVLVILGLFLGPRLLDFSIYSNCWGTSCPTEVSPIIDSDCIGNVCWHKIEPIEDTYVDNNDDDKTSGSAPILLGGQADYSYEPFFLYDLGNIDIPDDAITVEYYVGFYVKSREADIGEIVFCYPSEIIDESWDEVILSSDNDFGCQLGYQLDPAPPTQVGLNEIDVTGFIEESLTKGYPDRVTVYLEALSSSEDGKNKQIEIYSKESDYTPYLKVKYTRTACKSDEYQTEDGGCVKFWQNCIDNNLDGECDQDEPIILCLDTNNDLQCNEGDQLCSDRDGDGVCDEVTSLFCVDTNNNNICDSSEVMFWTTHCEDTNNNAVCDDRESEGVYCPRPYSPVCGVDDVTYPDECFADALGVSVAYTDKCTHSNVIQFVDCTSPEIDCPPDYICSPYSGEWGAVCIKTESIYIDTNCLTTGCPLDYTCVAVADTYTCLLENVQTLDCYTLGCPNPYTQTCIGGVCVEERLGICPDDFDCSDFGLVCNENTGICVQDRYITETCLDGSIECPAGYKCVEVSPGKGVCREFECRDTYDCPSDPCDGMFYSCEDGSCNLYGGCETTIIDDFDVDKIKDVFTDNPILILVILGGVILIIIK